MTMRAAILAPFHTQAVQEFITASSPGTPAPPRGMGGYCIVSLVKERLKRGLPTDVITLDPTATEPVMRWSGGLFRLWVVRRRIRRALRDGYRQEVRLLQQALRESNPDVCHANWTYEYGLAAVTQKEYPVVLGLTGTFFLHNLAHQALPSTWVLYTGYRFHWTSAQVGLSLAIVGLMAALVQGGLARRLIPALGERRSIVA